MLAAETTVLMLHMSLCCVLQLCPTGSHTVPGGVLANGFPLLQPRHGLRVPWAQQIRQALLTTKLNGLIAILKCLQEIMVAPPRKVLLGTCIGGVPGRSEEQS